MPLPTRDILNLLRDEMDAFVRRRIAFLLLVIVSAALLTALAPVAFKLLIDGFSAGTGLAGQSQVQNSVGKAPADLVWLVPAFVISHWLARVLAEVRGLVYARIDRRMYRTLSQRLFAHVMQLPLRFHLERKTGALGQTLTNGLQGFQMVFQNLIFTVLPVIAELATVAIVLIQLDQPTFLVVFVLAIAAYAAAFTHGIVRTNEPARAVSAAHIDAHAVMTDSLINYETVKYFGAEGLVGERFESQLTRTESEWMRFFRRKAWNGLIVATIFAFALLVTTGYAAYNVRRGTMTIGDFVLINTYLLQVVKPIEMLGYGLQQLSQGFAFLEKMIELFRQAPEARAASGQALAPDVPGRLEFQDVSLAYRPDRSVLRGVSFTVSPGCTLGIVGASGAGKSSIVRLLVRLFEPDGGRILLDEIPTSELSLDSLRHAIAVVPQDTVLFNETIRYNIAFGKPGSSDEEIEQAARLAHLHEFVKKLPDGYDTLVGERGVKLSGGEKQRVSIARAALKRPRIYVFDEATSSLDSRTEGEILRNLRELSREATTLVIAHRLSTVVHADEIIVLDDGAILERGTHAALLEQSGRYAALWWAQQDADAREAQTA